MQCISTHLFVEFGLEEDRGHLQLEYFLVNTVQNENVRTHSGQRLEQKRFYCCDENLASFEDTPLYSQGNV